MSMTGTPWLCGYNAHEQLVNGNNINSNVSLPVSGLNNVIAIVVGDSHSLAFRLGGTVRAWSMYYDC